LRDEEKLLPWFYSILNNAITDLYRRQQVEMRSLQQVAVVYDATVVGEAQMRDVLAEADYPVVETDAAQPEGLTLVEAGASCGCCRI
jgi:DNA-directed RNA polymerase specialized sigma24 family protein